MENFRECWEIMLNNDNTLNKHFSVGFLVAGRSRFPRTTLPPASREVVGLLLGGAGAASGVRVYAERQLRKPPLWK